MDSGVLIYMTVWILLGKARKKLCIIVQQQRRIYQKPLSKEAENWQKQRVLSIIPDQPVRDQWEYAREVELCTFSDQAIQEEWLLQFLIHFLNSLHNKEK